VLLYRAVRACCCHIVGTECFSLFLDCLCANCKEAHGFSCILGILVCQFCCLHDPSSFKADLLVGASQVLHGDALYGEKEFRRALVMFPKSFWLTYDSLLH
jgi:hypothetical protein